MAVTMVPGTTVGSQPRVKGASHVDAKGFPNLIAHAGKAMAHGKRVLHRRQRRKPGFLSYANLPLAGTVSPVLAQHVGIRLKGPYPPIRRRVALPGKPGPASSRGKGAGPKVPVVTTAGRGKRVSSAVAPWSTLRRLPIPRRPSSQARTRVPRRGATLQAVRPARSRISAQQSGTSRQVPELRGGWTSVGVGTQRSSSVAVPPLKRNETPAVAQRVPKLPGSAWRIQAVSVQAAANGTQARSHWRIHPPGERAFEIGVKHNSTALVAQVRLLPSHKTWWTSVASATPVLAHQLGERHGMQTHIEMSVQTGFADGSRSNGQAEPFQGSPGSYAQGAGQATPSRGAGPALTQAGRLDYRA